MKLTPRQFKCPVCQEIRERGVFVRIGARARRGEVIKVCKRAECARTGRSGRMWIEDPLLAFYAKQREEEE